MKREDIEVHCFFCTEKGENLISVQNCAKQHGSILFHKNPAYIVLMEETKVLSEHMVPIDCPLRTMGIQCKYTLIVQLLRKCGEVVKRYKCRIQRCSELF